MDRPSAMVQVLLISMTLIAHLCTANILYPIESESRELRTLHGLWYFKISPPLDQMVGFNNKWYTTKFETVSQNKKITINSIW